VELKIGGLLDAANRLKKCKEGKESKNILTGGSRRSS
jgi:hypothetical protein